MKLVAALIASLFAVGTAFAQAPAAPAKKEEVKPAAKPAEKKPADATKSEPAKKDDKKPAEPAKK